MSDAFPLAWPDGWPRTSPTDQVDGRFRFKRPTDNGRRPWTFAAARSALVEELARLTDLDDAVISSNWPLDRKGHARADARRPADEAIAIYFTRGGRQFAMACDRYVRAEENMRSLTLAIDAMRQLERHGGGVMMEKAFAGFAALPPPPSCWEILGLQPGASDDQVDAAYRARARHAHPDRGGSNAAMASLNAARDAARALLKDAR
ncbi:MAG: DnaJ domain-containing protein [Phenylobacterium sp.]|nr:DnaJ domain-containing protein [Phenylobacterium sp.]